MPAEPSLSDSDFDAKDKDVLSDAPQERSQASSINESANPSPAAEQNHIDTDALAIASNDSSSLEYIISPSTQATSEISPDYNQEALSVSETDVMVLDSVLMTCPDAWENLDDLCQCYGTHNLATPEGDRLELEEVLRLLYQNSMTLPDIIIAINTDREHVSRQQE